MEINNNPKLFYPDNKLIEMYKKIWDAIHRYIAYAFIMIALGIYIGITVSKIFYTNKMKEAIAVNGMVFEKEVYTIIKK